MIEITGTLPEGVTVSYTTNKGTVVGTYNATAKFTYDTANYNTIADMNAVLTINKTFPLNCSIETLFPFLSTR